MRQLLEAVAKPKQPPLTECRTEKRERYRKPVTGKPGWHDEVRIAGQISQVHR